MDEPLHKFTRAMMMKWFIAMGRAVALLPETTLKAGLDMMRHSQAEACGISQP